MTDSCHSLDELAHVLAESFAAGPLALAVSEKRVGGRVFLMGRAEKDKKRSGCFINDYVTLNFYLSSRSVQENRNYMLHSSKTSKHLLA